MEIPETQRKLREACFFLDKMRRRSGKAFGEREHEEFRFYLSAFLNAGRSVTLVLQKEQKTKYDAFYPEWFSKFSEEDRNLFKFMNEQRVAEFHKTGASHEEQEQAIPVYNVYEDESGRVEVFGPPAIFMSGPPATVHKPTYYFDLYGQRKEVIDVCTRYVTILTKLLQEFCETLKDKNE